MLRRRTLLRAGAWWSAGWLGAGLDVSGLSGCGDDDAPADARRFVPPMCSAFDAGGGALDLGGQQQLYEWYVRCGADALLISGYTSEFFELLDAEHLAQLDRARAAVPRGRGAVPLFDSVSSALGASYGTPDFLAGQAAFIALQQERGVQVSLLLPGYMAPQATDSFVAAAAAVARATAGALGIYEAVVPVHRLVSVAEYEQLWMQFGGRFVLHKDTSGDLARMQALLEVAPTGWALYNVPTSVQAQAFDLGATGALSFAGAFFPELMAFACHRWPSRRARRAVEWMVAVDGFVSDPASYPLNLKSVLRRRGLPIEPVTRLTNEGQPLRPPGTDQIDQLLRQYADVCARLGVRLVRP